MGGAEGSALEWALALLQAPSERYALRDRPLPTGIDRLLAVAAGTVPEVLSEAAAAFNEAPERLREAARFYAREVMFFPGADAYRVLGVSADASAQQIKAHYRLLQAWLHPDRPGCEDDAAFAGRVNAAWNQLRTPARRRAYDAERAAQQAAVEAKTGMQVTHPPTIRGWHDMPVPLPDPSDRWRQRWPILALSSLCLVLFWLAWRDMARSPEGLVEDAADMGPALEIAASSPAARLPVVTQSPPAGGVKSRRVSETAHAHGSVRAPVAAAPLRTVSRERPVATAAALAHRTDETRPVFVPAAGATVSSGAVVDAGTPQRIESIPGPESVGREAVAAAVPLATDRVEAVAAVAEPDFGQLQQARQTGEALLRYLRARSGTVPPIWNSPAAQEGAEAVRQRLLNQERVRFGSVQWQIGTESARLTALVETRAEPAAQQLVARLRWREGLWLVTGVSLEDRP
jgi:hypothetical protein